MLRIIISISILGLLLSCSNPLPEKENIGRTQGTFYSIKYHSTDRDFQREIDSILIAVDRSMSLWLEFSTISKVNTTDSFAIMDPLFKKVLMRSFEISKLTKGSFDPTVAPLVNAYGFGPGESSNIDSALIDSLHSLVGLENIYVNHDTIRLNYGQKLDFNAIAQGYTVDLVSEYLGSQGVENYMVEIGGELRTRGLNRLGKPWSIGIEKPNENVKSRNKFNIILGLTDISLATSGNYRKFHTDEITGDKYVHTINPKTGYPVRSNLLSATILSNSCMDADAFATACMVKGFEGSVKLIEKIDGIEGYLIYLDEKGEMKEWSSSHFDQYKD